VRRAGLAVPLNARSASEARRRSEALARLERAFPTCTLRHIFTPPHTHVSAEQLAAVGALRASGFLSWATNDRCCTRKGGHDGVADICRSNPNTWCNLTGQDGDICSIGSDLCPAPPPE
jgi:hypothetical protein